ncbi:MAG TPA: DUF2232 domain-containing protein [Candidatus Binatia bacterium]|nr:DUF2232 domain-containing protein [Candidatus Binatia bacterium]
MQRLEVVSRFFLALTSSLFLFVSGLGLPPLGMVLFPFVIQPVLIFGLKYGVGGGLGVLAVAILLLALLAAEELALIYGIFAVMAGTLLAALGRIRAIEYLVVGVAAGGSVLAAGLMFYFYGSWGATVGDLRQVLTQQLTSAARMQEKMGLAQPGLEKFQEQMAQMIDLILQLLPALLFLSFALIALINLLYLGRRFPERRKDWFTIASLREWKGPEPLVWGLIASGFALFIPNLGWLWTAALNLLVVISAFYFAQGLAVIAFFFHKNNVPRFLRGLTYVLIVFQQIFTLLVVGLGLFDLWGDFRRLGKDDLTPSRAA